MVRVSYDQKPYRRGLIEAFGGRVVASPSEETNAGRTILAENPDSTGSLGIAISEAVESAAPARTRYSTRLGAQPRPHAPDGDRRRGADADGRGGGLSGHPHRLHRWRLELLGPRFRSSAARSAKATIRVIAVEPFRLPELDEGPVRVRFRRHRPPHPARQDAYPGVELHPAAVPRGRSALPRHGTAGEPSPRSSG